MNEFDCPKCGKVNPTVIYDSFPQQADCPNCGATLEENDSLKVLSEEESKKMRPEFYKDKATPEEVEKARKKLAETCNDPNFVIVTCTCPDVNKKYTNGNNGVCKDCPIDAKK